jgi:hypothetical protein
MRAPDHRSRRYSVQAQVRFASDPSIGLVVA